jgi:hypothetical protein
MVNRVEQSEIWGTFRVARRAEPLNASMSETENGGFVFTGSHNGYRRLPERVTHTREIRGHAKSGWTVSDILTGNGECEVRSFIHFHPDVRIEKSAHNEWRISIGEEFVATLAVEDYCSAELSEADYCPEFGLRLRGAVISVAAEGALPIELGYHFAWADKA